MSKQRQDPYGYRNDDDPRDIWDKVGDYAKPAAMGGVSASVLTALLARRSRAYKAGMALPLGAAGGAILGPVVQVHEARKARYEREKKKHKNRK